jgi:serine/threonine protein phosphatase PrpC
MKENNIIIITEHINQLCKGQDYTISGETIYNNIKIKYAAIFDGHGSDDIINLIRSISIEKMNEIMSNDNPGKLIFDYINDLYTYTNYRSSGSTMCLARIFPNYIEVTNIGDSRAVIFKNGKIQIITKEHNCNNKDEYTRISAQPNFLKFEYTTNIKIINNSFLSNYDSYYVLFKDNTMLALTQALGHNGKTGIKPDIYTVDYNQNDNLRILIGSDGFFDMIYKDENSNEIILEDLYEIADLPGQVILNRAVNRWLQEWKVYPYKNKSIIETQTFNKTDCDDVSLIIIDII